MGMEGLLGKIDSLVWGLPLIILLLGTGIYLTIRLKGIQFTKLLHSLYLAFIKRKEKGDAEGDISHFEALMTALSATVGTGNIAGVATAIIAGGPGALFWMWITGLFGMATKFSEAVLAVHYRVTDENGQMAGGPMYYLRDGLKSPFLAFLFALFTSIAAFGIGNMVQSNSVADAVKSSFGVPVYITGIILAVATAIVILGGIKSIGRVTSFLVPFMIVVYMGAAIIVIIMEIDKVPYIFNLIIKSAFSGHAAVGGFAGATVREALRFGVARGIFSNESGLGSSPIAAAAAKTKHPVTQALVSMTQTFIDTIVVCSMTGFVILVTGSWKLKGVNGASLTSVAFSNALGKHAGSFVVALGLILFAYSTILGWSYYGEKAIEYLLGVKAIKPYRVAFVILVLIGSILKIDVVWTLADIFNGLMAIPNLIGLLGLSGVIVKVTSDYFKNSVE
ncbi:alanine or glycine:cation symporter, AGCS family [Thermotomaculum hydrothermale]|uniref:Alanine or glycine:cation symporter, AGCS family n=2 Tax=Thermotomaculum hydrothermale TaxID=981385 RepID=A0A7R6PE84_9BACT|nr:alanine or glycine:cation symporter, AGCS family [Thermotomaculum hydrothermale]